MNDANKQATGFKLGSLQRLVNTKDEQNRRNFLDFVERTVRSKFPQYDTFLDELHECHALEKMDIDNLLRETKIYIDNVKNIQTSIDFGNLSDKSKFHPQDKVLSTVLPVLAEARKKAGYLSDHLKEVSATYDKLLTFFGEDPSDESARKGFFRKISQFLKDYKVCNQVSLLQLSVITYTNLIERIDISPEECGPRRRRKASRETSVDAGRTNGEDESYSICSFSNIYRGYGNLTRKATCRRPISKTHERGKAAGTNQTRC